MWEHSHTRSAHREPRRARTRGRPNVAQHASWRPLVHTSAYGASSSAQPAPEPAPEANDSVAVTTWWRSSTIRRRARAAVTPGRPATTWTRRTPSTGPWWWVSRSRRIVMTRMPRARIALRQIGGAWGPSSLSSTASRPHEPCTSMSSHALTCDAVAHSGSARSAAATAHSNRTGRLGRNDHSLDSEPLYDRQARRLVQIAGRRGGDERIRMGEQVSEQRMSLSGKVELAVTEPEHRATSGRSRPHRQPQQGAGRESHGRIDLNLGRHQRPQAGRRLAMPDLLGQPWPQARRVEVASRAAAGSGGAGSVESRLRAGIEAVSCPAATAASTARRTARCQVIASTPIVRCDDAASMVSAACGKPRGR